jgi:hypothetical protein
VCTDHIDLFRKYISRKKTIAPTDREEEGSRSRESPRKKNPTYILRACLITSHLEVYTTQDRALGTNDIFPLYHPFSVIENGGNKDAIIGLSAFVITTVRNINIENGQGILSLDPVLGGHSCPDVDKYSSRPTKTVLVHLLSETRSTVSSHLYHGGTGVQSERVNPVASQIEAKD